MKTICFDFDGVIATFDGWKGFDVLGKPQKEVIWALRELKAKGYRIVIFTTRPATEILVGWLKKYDVPYDDINRNSHNPVMTSCKPIYHAIIDDRAINYHGQSRMELLKNLDDLLHGMKE